MGATAKQVWLINGQIKEQTFLDIISRFNSGNTSELILNVCSEGGSFMYGQSIANYLETLKSEGVKIVTRGFGYVASAAANLFLAGDVREIARDCYFRIHQVSLGDGSILTGAKASDLLAYARDFESSDNGLAQMYSTKTGNSVEQCLAWMQEDTDWIASTVIERGFAHRYTDEKPLGALKANRVMVFCNEARAPMIYKKYLEDNLGYLRENMPQIDSDIAEAYLTAFQMRYQEHIVTYGKARACDVHFTQSDINEQKVIQAIARGNYKDRVFLAARGKKMELRLIDGHHDLAAALQENERQTLNVAIINLPIKRVIEESNKMKAIWQDTENIQDFIFGSLII
ncbi:MAG: ATP-dependent Clp protease proteolytic subunit [Bacteroidales bacterium]